MTITGRALERRLKDRIGDTLFRNRVRFDAIAIRRRADLIYRFHGIYAMQAPRVRADAGCGRTDVKAADAQTALQEYARSNPFDWHGKDGVPKWEEG